MGRLMRELHHSRILHITEKQQSEKRKKRKEKKEKNDTHLLHFVIIHGESGRVHCGLQGWQGFQFLHTGTATGIQLKHASSRKSSIQQKELRF